MTSAFSTYFQVGFLHICDLRATDHLTFLLALCAPFVLADWRRLLALVTSFTLGHSLTLALATLGILSVNTSLIEALIPLTIMATAVFNISRAGLQPTRRAPMLFTASNALATGFGLIHGLGFSNYLSQLLGRGRRPVLELLAFNLGVEVGQLLIVAGILVLGFLVLRGLRVARRDWVLVVSGAALGIAALLLVQLLG
ncbi:HupE/UreJ family protein [Hymenobacter saemangeumensis]|uniref:HupE/UreJ family protein n=1 Tax=Hymenobacter saemangeumensis TaxID=1084522 RepID=A0ABP8ILN3_9BACT